MKRPSCGGGSDLEAENLSDERLAAVGSPFVAERRPRAYIRATMIELRLLGLHGLRGSDGRELAALPAQPKRFAVLAYLAIASGDGYHRRDTVAAMFWPDLDEFAARRALRNTLYHLRDALGDGVIIARGDDAISVAPSALVSDVGRLREAVDAGRYEDAIDCYRGVLLDGMHLVNAGEAFEEWLSRERRNVDALLARAFDGLIDREESAGNMVAAAHWAERACVSAPDDERCVRRALLLLERTGDTGRALRLYDSYTNRLAAEFAATPSAETQSVARRIQQGGGSLLQPESATSLPLSATRPNPPPPQATFEESPSRTPTVPAERGTTRIARRRRIAFWLGSVAAASTIGLFAPWSTRAARWRGEAPSRVLIAVFDNRTGNSELSSLGRMTQDWITQGVVGTHVAEVVDPRAVFVQGRSAGANADPIAMARRTGAGTVVSGNYYLSSDTLLFQASVVDVRSGRIVRAVGPVVSNVHTPIAALDELRSRVLSAIASAVDTHATQDLDHTELPPFDAYRDYIDGWDAFWHGDNPRAEALFLRASSRDSAFTPAPIAAAMVAANSNDCPLVDSLSRVLEARSQSLARRDHLALQIDDARCRGRNDEMLRLTIERADLEPGNAAAQMSAAAAANWANRPQRALELYTRVDPVTDLAWSTDTTHRAYWGGVAGALHMLGRHREELAAADRVAPGAPLDRVWLRGSALAALSRPTELLALIDSSLSLPVEPETDIGLAPFTDGRPQYTVTPGWVANWISRELAFHGDTATARQAAMRAVAWYRSRPADERATPEERLVASWSLEMVGAYAEAERIARQLVAEDSANVDFRGELAGLAVERGEARLADSLDRWLAAQPVARVSWSASVYRARVAALRNRPDDAVARVREALDEGAWPTWFHEEAALAVLQTRSDFEALLAPKH